MDKSRRRNVCKGLLVLLLIAILFPFWSVFAKVTKRFSRKIMRHRGDTLQTPVVFYEHPETKRSLVFVAVIHIGEKDYFPALQRLIDSHSNHMVLYEMIGKLTPKERAALTKEEQQVLRQEFEAVKELIEAVQTLLGLTYQKEGLKYASHWVNTDLTMFELLRIFVEQKLHLFKKPFKPLEWQKDRQLVQWLLDVLLRNFVPIVTLLRLVGWFSSAKRGEKKIVLDLRNKIALEAIHENLREKDVLTIWGAAHLLGMEKSIHAAGFREVGREWFDAYRARNYSLWSMLCEAVEQAKKTKDLAARVKK